MGEGGGFVGYLAFNANWNCLNHCWLHRDTYNSNIRIQSYILNSFDFTWQVSND